MEPVEPRMANFFTRSIFAECGWGGCGFGGSMQVPLDLWLKYLDSIVYDGWCVAKYSFQILYGVLV